MKSALVVALGMLVACGGEGGTTAISETSPSSASGDGGGVSEGGADAVGDAGAAPTAAGTSGCGLANVAAGTHDETMKVGGETRRYKLLVPAGYDATRPTRLVFVFHGLGGDGDQIRAYFGFEAEAHGQALFVYPDGLPQSLAGGETGWAESDLSFFDAMVTEVSAAYCVDSKRIFAAGHSFGGYMSNLVGCERSDVVRAIAPVSGGLVAGACKGPVAVWLAHGDKDSTVAQSEGLSARDHWIGANGCASTSAPTTPSPCVTYEGCSAGHPVTWCSFSGGHFPLPQFTQQAIWDFFEGM